MNWLRKLFCRHPDLRFVRNIYGDVINECGGKRSVYKCADCGRYVYKNELEANHD